AALESRHFLGPGTLHGALHVLDSAELRLFAFLGAASLEPGEPLELLVSGPEHLSNGALLHVAAGGLDSGQVLGLPEHVDETCGLPSRAAHLPPLRQPDPPPADP